MKRCALWLVLLAVPVEAQETRFEISFPATAHAELLTGRVYVMISRTGETEPRLQISQTGGTPSSVEERAEASDGRAAASGSAVPTGSALLESPAIAAASP
jgi:hypothetical protein